MLIDIDREHKLIGIWLEKDEEVVECIPSETNELMNLLKRNKYTVCVYHPGTRPQRDVIRDLVMNNIVN